MHTIFPHRFGGRIRFALLLSCATAFVGLEAAAETLPTIEPLAPLGAFDARDAGTQRDAPLGLIQLTADRLGAGQSVDYFTPVAFDAVPPEAAEGETLAWCEHRPRPGAPEALHRAALGTYERAPRVVPPAPGRFGPAALRRTEMGACVPCRMEVSADLAALPTDKGQIAGAGGYVPTFVPAVLAGPVAAAPRPRAAGSAPARGAVSSPAGAAPAIGMPGVDVPLLASASGGTPSVFPPPGAPFDDDIDVEEPNPLGPEGPDPRSVAAVPVPPALPLLAASLALLAAVRRRIV